jgi:hypothetical protein
MVVKVSTCQKFILCVSSKEFRLRSCRDPGRETGCGTRSTPGGMPIFERWYRCCSRGKSQNSVLRTNLRVCASSGIEFISFPIRDRGVPRSYGALNQLIVPLLPRVRGGLTVAVRCRAESHFKVIRRVRPKLSCGNCQRIVRPLAPSRPIERGVAGPGLRAHVLVPFRRRSPGCSRNTR